VCCWRFVRLEADGGYEAEQDHTPRVYIYIYICAVPPLRRTSGTSREPSRSFFSQLRPLRSSRPFHLIPSFTRDSDCDSALPGSVLLGRACLSPCRSFLPISRDRPRSYLSRMFPATGTAGRSCSPRALPPGTGGREDERCAGDMRDLLSLCVAIGWIGRFFILIS